MAVIAYLYRTGVPRESISQGSYGSSLHCFDWSEMSDDVFYREGFQIYSLTHSLIASKRRATEAMREAGSAFQFSFTEKIFIYIKSFRMSQQRR